MYGLKQAVVLAHENLKKNLAQYGYTPINQTDSFWQHKTRPTKFCLCINDFGVKYFDKGDINHLINSLLNNYKLSTDFSGQKSIGEIPICTENSPILSTRIHETTVWCSHSVRKRTRYSTSYFEKRYQTRPICSRYLFILQPSHRSDYDCCVK